jgi:hypothetical protein
MKLILLQGKHAAEHRFKFKSVLAVSSECEPRGLFPSAEMPTDFAHQAKEIDFGSLMRFWNTGLG